MSRLRRLEGCPYVGFAYYFLTICAFNRQQVFKNHDAVNGVMTHFRQAAARERFAFLAYCFMPDHSHFLVEGTSSESNLRKFVDSAKQHSGFAYARAEGRRLWQEGYYDRVLRPNEEPKWVARYILENPVRGRLVESPLDYPFLGSDIWSIEELIESCR
jgi:putative transposase